MAISYCGVPLLLHDPPGGLSGFMGRSFRESDGRYFGRRPPAEESLEEISLQRHPERAPMPRFNWPNPPPPAINRLYIPVTGATRWATGLFLIDADIADKVVKALATDDGGPLVITDNGRSAGKAQTLTAKMYALPMKTIANGDSPRLLLLPLVDRRYFWQFIELGATVSDSTTWASLITSLSTAVGGNGLTNSSIASNYYRPDRLEFNRKHGNAAQLIDAVCASTMRRLVYSIWKETATLQTALEAELAYGLVADQQYPTAGTDQSADEPQQGNIPYQVETLCPEHVGRLPYGSGGSYGRVRTAASASHTSNQPTGTAWDILSTAAADLTGQSPGGTPNNATDLNSLGDQLGDDFYLWLAATYDFTTAGLYSPDPIGFEDFHLLDLRGTIQTRVATLPVNVGPTSNWCQVTTVDTPHINELWPGPSLRVCLKGDLTPGGSVDCYPLLWTGTAYDIPETGGTPDTTKKITVYDEPARNRRAFGTDTLSTAYGAMFLGARGVACFNPDNGRWEFRDLQVQSKIIRVTAPCNCAANGTFAVTSVTLVRDDQQDPCSGGRSQTIQNWSMPLCEGDLAECVYNPSTHYYDVIDGPCETSCTGGSPC